MKTYRLLYIAGLLCLQGAAVAQDDPAQPAVTSPRASTTARAVYGARQRTQPATSSTGLLYQWSALNRTVPDVSVDLDLDNVDAAAALRAVADQAKVELSLDKDVPSEARITIRAKKIKLATALDMISQAAGIHWSAERKDGKTTIHAGKSRISVSTTPLTPYWVADKTSPNLTFRMADPSLSPLISKGYLTPDLGTAPLFYSLSATDQRSTFACPHCKGQVTVIRPHQQPKCPKCGRTFQSEWQFCPVDGSKRPSASGSWKFCPLCGKEVQMEKDEPKRSGAANGACLKSGATT